MSQKVRRKIKGYCPYLDSTHVIEAAYNEIQFAGSPMLNYTFSSYKCDYSMDCRKECPLAKQAEVFIPNT